MTFGKALDANSAKLAPSVLKFGDNCISVHGVAEFHLNIGCHYVELKQDTTNPR